MVSRLVEQRTRELAEPGRPITVTPQFIAGLVDLIYQQLVSVGKDLELFANHAGRKMIKPDDMMMIVRRNRRLAGLLRPDEALDEEYSMDI